MSTPLNIDNYSIDVYNDYAQGIQTKETSGIDFVDLVASNVEKYGLVQVHEAIVSLLQTSHCNESWGAFEPYPDFFSQTAPLFEKGFIIPSIGDPTIIAERLASLQIDEPNTSSEQEILISLCNLLQEHGQIQNDIIASQARVQKG